MCLFSHAVDRLIGKCQNSLCRGMSTCEKKFFPDMMKRILVHQSCCITELRWDKEKSPNRVWKKSVRYLPRFAPLLGSVRLTRFLFSFLKGSIHAETIVCVDGVDIAKPYSGKSEGMHTIYDSSRKKTCSGFMYQSCSIGGIPVYVGEEVLSE